MAECIRCGFCCKQAICPWGIWDEVKHCCVYLTEQTDGTYLCNRHDEIVARLEDYGHPDDPPAFGGGCSSTLCNIDRNKLLKHKDS